jgi:hypothetical protein
VFTVCFSSLHKPSIAENGDLHDSFSSHVKGFRIRCNSVSAGVGNGGNVSALQYSASTETKQSQMFAQWKKI